MEPSTEIRRVAVVGTGVIGASWPACFLAHGLDVVATDPTPGAEEALRRYITTAWLGLGKLGLAPGGAPSRLGGGAAGIRHFFEQFAGPMTAWWADLRSPSIARPELQRKIVEGVADEVAGRSFETLSHKRDALLTGLLELRARHG